MVIEITDPELEREIEALAARRGESAVQVVTIAVRQMGAGHDVEVRQSRRPSVEEILALIRSFPKGPVNYDLTEDEILGYGPNGYPE